MDKAYKRQDIKAALYASFMDSDNPDDWAEIETAFWAYLEEHVGPPVLSTTQVIDTVQAGASVVGMKITSLG